MNHMYVSGFLLSWKSIKKYLVLASTISPVRPQYTYPFRHLIHQEFSLDTEI